MFTAGSVCVPTSEPIPEVSPKVKSTKKAHIYYTEVVRNRDAEKQNKEGEMERD